MIEHKLTFDARAGEQRIGLLYLCRFLKSVLSPPKHIVEIGSYCGASGKIIAQSFPDATVHCVDPWKQYTEDCSTYDLDRQALELQESESIFDEIAASQTNMMKHRTSSADFAPFMESADFVYIDGNHQYSSVIADLHTWYPRIKLGGAICGHDYSWPSIQSALKSFFNMNPDAIFCDGSWLYFVNSAQRKTAPVNCL
jgi:predicted O-methyltransferase YrrM